MESWDIVIGTAEESINGFFGGCQLCEVFVRRLLVTLRHPRAEEFSKYTVKMSKTTSKPKNKRSRSTWRLGEPKFHVVCEPEKDLFPPGKWFSPETEWELSLDYKVKSATPLQANWDIDDVRKRLATCDSSHACRTSQGLTLPTRLLDLGTPEHGDEMIKLILTSDQDMDDKRYVALSYCWGASPPFTTQPSTLSERMRGFSVRDMPATLRESVQVTRDLGIRYIWIDALCILQGGRDDREAREDWQRESAQMHKVYGNAYLTLAAAGSLNSEGGLVNGTPWCRVPYYRSESGNDDMVVADEDAVLSLTVYKSSAQADRGALFYEEPLASRAWAYQEWVLSSRLLVFMSAAPLSFVCNQQNPLNMSPNAARLVKLSPSWQSRGYGVDADAADVWPSVVQSFTSRRLTAASDKLPALSGVAQRLSDEGTRGEYLAGLWRASLLRDLLWYVPSPNYGLGKTSAFMMHETSRAVVDGTPRAPSWSWAAIEGFAVTHEGFVATQAEPGWKDMATVVQCDVQLASQDHKFGAVGPGLLTITCPFLVVDRFGMKLDHRYFSEADQRRHIQFWIDDEAEWVQLIGRELPAEIPWEIDWYARLSEVSALPAKLYCLAIAREMVRVGDDGMEISAWAGIVVKEREGNPQRFHRVGYFHYGMRDKPMGPDIDSGITRTFEIE